MKNKCKREYYSALSPVSSFLKFSIPSFQALSGVSYRVKQKHQNDQNGRREVGEEEVKAILLEFWFRKMTCIVQTGNQVWKEKMLGQEGDKDIWFEHAF